MKIEVSEKQSLVGKDQDAFLKHPLGDFCFIVLAESRYTSMIVVEYVPDGGNPKVKYFHENEFKVEEV